MRAVHRFHPLNKATAYGGGGGAGGNGSHGSYGGNGGNGGAATHRSIASAPAEANAAAYGGVAAAVVGIALALTPLEQGHWRGSYGGKFCDEFGRQSSPQPGGRNWRRRRFERLLDLRLRRLRRRSGRGYG